MPRAAPSPADIAVAIGKVAAGDWIDPLDAPLNWLCLLYDSEGFEIALKQAGIALQVAERHQFFAQELDAYWQVAQVVGETDRLPEAT